MSGLIAGIGALDRSVDGLRVLLAEDNIVNQKVAVNILRRLGCEVEAVMNGRLAVEAVTHGDYDVILMDMQMPELDGLAATAAIRSLPLMQRSLPIIAVTANALPSDREACLASGMDDFMPKPITSADLLAMLVKWDARRAESPTPMIPSDNPIYDTAPLEEAFGDDHEFVTTVLSEYLSSSVPLIDAIQGAIELNDGEALERAAHGLRGSSRTVGAMRVAHVAGELEALGRSGTCEGALEVLPRLRDEFGALSAELERRFHLTA